MAILSNFPKPPTTTPTTPKSTTTPATPKPPTQPQPTLPKAQKPVQQLTSSIVNATNIATVATRSALGRMNNPTSAQANQLLHQNYSSAIAQSTAAKAGQVLGPTAIKQVQAINQALSAALLHPQGRTANIEDIRELARYRTQLLADLVDASSSPAQKAKTKDKLAEAYAIAQKALNGNKQQKAEALYNLPQSIVPYGTWSNTYHEAAITLTVPGSNPKVRTIAETLSNNIMGQAVGELPTLAVGVGAPLVMGAARLPRRPSQQDQTPLPQRGTPARPVSETGTRSQNAQAQQQQRLSTYTYDAAKMPTNRLYLDINPKLRTGETAQQAAVRVRAANAELRMRVPQIAQADAMLKGARPHVMNNNFRDRALQDTTGSINLQTGSSKTYPIPAAQAVGIEPIPNSVGKPVGRYEFYNTPGAPRTGFLSGPNSLLPADGGYNFKFMTEVGKTPQGKPKYAESAQWNAGDKLPPGYRYRLIGSKIKSMGFSGGHSREAWNDTLQIYRDQIKIDASATQNIQYRTAQGGKLDTASQYRYTFDGKPVSVPKTIGGSQKTLESLEPAVANEVGKVMASGANLGFNKVVTVKVPVLNKDNKTMMLPIDVRVKTDPLTGVRTIESWYINEDAFKMKGLK